jgi:hypothetical protein
MIRVITSHTAETIPSWQKPQRAALLCELSRVVRVPHSPSGFRMIGVIKGGKQEEIWR